MADPDLTPFEMVQALLRTGLQTTTLFVMDDLAERGPLLHEDSGCAITEGTNAICSSERGGIGVLRVGRSDPGLVIARARQVSGHPQALEALWNLI